MMPGKKYPFIISNTESNKNGTRWWSILNISPKSELFFYSFRIDGMKHFIVQDDKKSVGKVLKGIELANRKDNKMKFSVNGYQNLTAKEIDKLPETAQDFFQLIYCFRKKKK